MLTIIAVAMSTNGQQSDSDMKIMRDAIKERSLRVGIKNLKDTVRQPGTEVRIWVGFGLLYPRIFIMRERNGRRQAFHITAKRNGKRITTPKILLKTPNSGWNEFAEFIKKQGIASPLKLSPDKEPEFDPDEEIIAIEVKSRGKYDMVYYESGTKSGDGRKAMEVCKKLEQEFGIMMGCPPEN